MLSCNCTLPYTNPGTCERCINEVKTNWNVPGWIYLEVIENIPTINYPFDSNRYELVEKKDWKIKQLKEELAHYEMKLKEEDTLRKESYIREGKIRLEQVKAMDELKELEK